MKHEWRKHEKELYGISKLPSMITVPKQNFITVSGRGNPNHTDFSERISVLYSLAYAIKTRYKVHSNQHDQSRELAYKDYTVYPLEGLWTSVCNNPLDKSTFDYTIMIRQPDVITKEMFEEAFAVVEKKKPHPLLKEVTFDTLEDGLCVQILHVGPYDDEPYSFEKMDKFAETNGLVRNSKRHREIYLNNAQRTIPSKYQTILRYQVKKD